MPAFRNQVHHQPTLAKRNLCDDFESDNSATLLPVPNSKETIQVYLRVKPRTLEESEISAASSSAASSTAAAADQSQEDADSTAVIGETADEGQLLQIESEHQVI